MFIIIKKKHIIYILIIIIFTFIITYPALSTSLSNKMPIIMYHNVVKGTHPKRGNYVIHPNEFEKDLIYLQSNGYTTILINDLIKYKENGTPLPEKPIILTFDDGHKSFLSYVVPLLEKYNMKAVVSVVGTYCDMATEQNDPNPDYSYLTWKDLKELSTKDFIEVQNHTYNMHNLTGTRIGCKICNNESTEEYQEILTYDLQLLQERLLKEANITPSTFTYPFGQLCKESIDVLKNIGFKAALTCNEQQINLENINLYRLGRFNRPSGISSEMFFKSVITK